jgi:uncharacterized protein
MHHWRTSGGAECDLVLERDGRFFPIEIKCKTTLSGHDVRSLRAFRATYPKSKDAPSLIIYAGRETYKLDEHTLALPWNAIVQQDMG